MTDTPDMTTSTGAYNASTSDPTLGLTPTTHQEGENVSETEYGSTETTTGSQTLGHTITNAHGETITHGYGETEAENGSVIHGHKLKQEHDLHVHGNIGVMSTQQMIKEQREIVSFNFYDKMIRDFIERFCILVY